MGEYLSIGNVVTGLGLARVVVSGRLIAGWEFIRGPLNDAVARSIAGRVAGLSLEPSERPGRGSAGRSKSRPSTT